MSQGNANLLDSLDLLGVEPGSRQWFEAQRQLILSRPLVRRTYDSWYGKMLGDVATAPEGAANTVLEIGSGAGYVKTLDPSVITSDIVAGLSDHVVDAQELPFPDSSLRAILLTHTFHHIPDVRRFLAEAARVVISGGVITMVDVAHTPLSRILFGRFHPEGYNSAARRWKLVSTEPVGGANQALSWIVFCRDRKLFEREFPNLRVECVEYLPWFGYALSGGVTRKSLVPSVATGVVSALDRASTFLNPLCALHWHIRLRRV